MNEPTTLTFEDRDKGIKIIHFHGDLDSVGVRMVVDAFASAIGDRAQRVVIDLSDVPFISSAGLEMILLKGKTLRRGGGILFLAGAKKHIQDILSLAGFEELFDIYATLEQALAALERG